MFYKLVLFPDLLWSSLLDSLFDRAQQAVRVGASAAEDPVSFREEEQAACWDRCGPALAAQVDAYVISDAIEWEQWDMVAFCQSQSHGPWLQFLPTPLLDCTILILSWLPAPSPSASSYLNNGRK